MNLDDIRGKAVITVDEAAELLGLDKQTVRRRCRDGSLPSVRLGRRTLIPVPRFLAIFEEKTD